ncbi:hypothetical protein Y1Q_0007424 [Alligator mississippiensis]|uniref:Uncharacterized protein n=1 Tax=Alligator mississippiensis TaxID=8496 RepID=A0A151P8S1_ALLMI|nr:hypothetical protein Y1Q_0007424 [Alligator mississippiensis]
MGAGAETWPEVQLMGGYLLQPEVQLAELLPGDFSEQTKTGSHALVRAGSALPAHSVLRGGQQHCSCITFNLAGPHAEHSTWLARAIRHKVQAAKSSTVMVFAFSHSTSIMEHNHPTIRESAREESLLV